MPERQFIEELFWKFKLKERTSNSEIIYYLIFILPTIPVS